MKTKLAIVLASCLAVFLIGLVSCSPSKETETSSKTAQPTSQSEKAPSTTSSETTTPVASTFTVDENGNVAPADGDTNASADGIQARINVDTQKAEYSVDGGKTWTDEKPEGL